MPDCNDDHTRAGDTDNNDANDCDSLPAIYNAEHCVSPPPSPPTTGATATIHHHNNMKLLKIGKNYT